MGTQQTITVNSLIRAVGATCFITGPAVLAYFLSNFTVDKSGYYYDGMEWGIAVGVLLITGGRFFGSWARP